jgi:hypothetical protein
MDQHMHVFPIYEPVANADNNNAVTLNEAHRLADDMDEVNRAFREIQAAFYNDVRDLLGNIPPEIVQNPFNWKTVNPLLYYRFNWQDLDLIAYHLDLPVVFRTENRLVMSREEGLCLLLFRLSHPSRYIDAQHIFHRSVSALSALFNVILADVYSNWKHLLLFDHVRLTPEYLEKLAAAVKRKGGHDALDNCWGFIDGTHVRVCRPMVDQEELYSGHKKAHSIKYQAIATPDGLISHLGGPFPGRRHDARMLTEFRIKDFLFQHSHGHGNRELAIYGDEGYGRLFPVLAPYRGTLTEEQNATNEGMRRPRLCVEWGFGNISNNWQFCNYRQRLRVGLMRVGMLYPVSTLLANLQVCLGRYTPTRSFYRIQPPSIEQYLTPRRTWEQQRVVMEEPDYFRFFAVDFADDGDDVNDIGDDDDILAFDYQAEDYGGVASDEEDIFDDQLDNDYE